MIPVEIKINKQKNLFIKWDDGYESEIELVRVRRACPCATCTSFLENQSTMFIPLFSSDQVAVSKIVEVGSYAIGIVWKDGHSTGIYEFPYLRSLMQK